MATVDVGGGRRLRLGTDVGGGGDAALPPKRGGPPPGPAAETRTGTVGEGSGVPLSRLADRGRGRAADGHGPGARCELPRTGPGLPPHPGWMAARPRRG